MSRHVSQMQSGIQVLDNSLDLLPNHTGLIFTNSNGTGTDYVRADRNRMRCTNPMMPRKEGQADATGAG
jgi:hypothetical protein